MLALHRYLAEVWRAPTDRPLLLIGPSGGWCLPMEWLRRFPSVLAVDIDPLALTVLRGRARHRNLQTLCADALGVHDTPPAVALARLLTMPGYTDASVLFCNLLGQVIFHCPEEEIRIAWQRNMEAAIGGRCFASFHDRLSGILSPELPAAGARSARVLDDDAVLQLCYPAALAARIPAALVDHGTGALFPSLPRTYLHWQLGPRAHHLIEVVSTSSDTEGSSR